MNVSKLLKKTEKLVSDNSPAILAGIGVAGTLATAYFAGKASFKAGDILRDERYKRNINNEPQMDRREQFEKVWKLYIPAVGTGLLTCGAIVMSNRVGMRRTAAMAAAYSISERAFDEYRTKVVERIGEGKEQGIRDEIAQDRVRNNPPMDREVIIAGTGDVLCKDLFSGRYFRSSMEEMKKAQNDINYQILHYDSASLTEFYSKLGLAPTSVSDDLGWNTNKLLELSFSTTKTENDEPCLTMDFATIPVRDPGRYL